MCRGIVRLHAKPAPEPGRWIIAEPRTACEAWLSSVGGVDQSYNGEAEGPVVELPPTLPVLRCPACPLTAMVRTMSLTVLRPIAQRTQCHTEWPRR